jgi:hypothetical protein
MPAVSTEQSRESAKVALCHDTQQPLRPINVAQDLIKARLEVKPMFPVHVFSFETSRFANEARTNYEPTAAEVHFCRAAHATSH